MLRHYAPLEIDFTRDRKDRGGIFGFRGEYRFLSNFYILDTPFTMHGLDFDSSERAYMWHKSDDRAYKRKVMTAVGPKACKAVGYRAVLRPDWETTKLQVMHDVLIEKFNDINLWIALIATGDRYLEETNTHGDRFWGVCNGEGENHLGRILMCVRHELGKPLTKKEKQNVVH